MERIIKKIETAIIVLIASLSSCSSNDDNIPKEEIVVSSNKIYLWNGHSTKIDILSDLTNPTLKCTDSDKVEYSLDGNTICITAKEIGSSGLIISQEGYNDATIEIYSGTFQGRLFEESIFESYGINYSVTIEADDEALGKELKRALLDSMQNKYKSRYSFDFRVPLAASINDQKNKNTTSYDGTYTFNEKESTLYLEYGEYKETYKAIPISYYVVMLIQDLTNQYVKLYPNSGIRNVITTKYLTTVKNP